MLKIETVFAVIDPSTDRQLALERAKRIARVSGAKIHAYLCIWSGLETHDPEALQKVEIARHQPWLDSVVQPVREEGFHVETELEWNEDWRTALAPAAKRAHSDLIVKATRRRSTTERLMMTSSDLALLNSSHCSIQLISSEADDDHHRVLIAVDANRDDEKYNAIFDAVVTFGKTVASSSDQGELHAVHAYSDSDELAHVSDIARRVGIETDNAHIASGSPDEAIAQIASEIDAHIIVIGLSTRSTLSNRIFGNVLDRLTKNVSKDILVVIPPGK